MIKLDNKEVKQGHFPDGTLLVKYEQGYFPNENVIEWNYENDGELFTLICLVRHIKEHNANSKIVLIMPYIPNARQDRVKSEEDIFTLKYFCEIINSLNFEKVLVTDAHSNVSLALLDRVQSVSIDYNLHQALTKIVFAETGDVMHEHRMECYENLITFYPDEGAMKRYSSQLDFPYAFGIKDRDWKTGEIKGLKLANEEIIKGKTVLIIDDICSKGGTFYYSAKALKAAGAANIYLYVTHCENTIHEGELLKDNDLIKHIYTTDSILTVPHEKITTVNVK